MVVLRLVQRCVYVSKGSHHEAEKKNQNKPIEEITKTLGVSSKTLRNIHQSNMFSHAGSLALGLMTSSVCHDPRRMNHTE